MKFWRNAVALLTVFHPKQPTPGITPPIKMLKMKVDPTICMKTKRERQNVMPEMRLFTRKRADYTVIDNVQTDLLADYAQIARQLAAKLRLPHG